MRSAQYEPEPARRTAPGDLLSSVPRRRNEWPRSHRPSGRRPAGRWRLWSARGAWPYQPWPRRTGRTKSSEGTPPGLEVALILQVARKCQTFAGTAKLPVSKVLAAERKEDQAGTRGKSIRSVSLVMVPSSILERMVTETKL